LSTKSCKRLDFLGEFWIYLLLGLKRITLLESAVI
ncbi:MAG: hypothetical protein ACI86L_001805, partial [Dokdonia sp.]